MTCLRAVRSPVYCVTPLGGGAIAGDDGVMVGHACGAATPPIRACMLWHWQTCLPVALVCALMLIACCERIYVPVLVLDAYGMHQGYYTGRCRRNRLCVRGNYRFVLCSQGRGRPLCRAGAPPPAIRTHGCSLQRLAQGSWARLSVQPSSGPPPPVVEGPRPHRHH